MIVAEISATRTSRITVNVGANASIDAQWTPHTALTPRENRLSRRPVRDSNILDVLGNAPRSMDAPAVGESPSQRVVLGSLCLTSMRAHLRPNILGIPMSWASQANVSALTGRGHDFIPPELDFACTHWARYVSHGSSNDEHLANAVEGFIEVRALWWLEVMSILGKTPQAVQSLTAVQKWAVGTSLSNKVISRLIEL